MADASFSASPVEVYAFTARFFDALRAAGVREVVISPGSRSTPLAITAERTPELRTWIGLDERSAAFFALGLAKAGRRPAVLVCTSGTAAANYLPAIVEAHYSRVPLIVLTADRPPELRDWGAGQTIEQRGLYADYVRWSVEVPIEVAGADARRYAARLAARSVAGATGPPAGAVHLNWPLREPLAPVAETPGYHSADEVDAELRFSRSVATADPDDLRELARLVATHERGVICCGPMDVDGELPRSLAAFARAAGWPIFADPASQLRSVDPALAAPVLDMGDGLARVPAFVERMRPEVVLRFGDTPVSKAQRLWLEAVRPAEVWWFDEGGHWGEPSHRATRVVRGGAASLLERVTSGLERHVERKSDWCRRLVELDGSARASLRTTLAGSDGWSGLAVADRVSSRMRDGGILFASNSMSIRLLDLGFARRGEGLRVLCNRGASGIDGVTSTALGAAAAAARPALLLTGDLAFLHDLGGLLVARHAAIPLTIVVLDDNGGGIFSFLPVAAQGEAVAFDRLFRTPHDLDLARAAGLFEIDYHRVEDAAGLDAALDRALASPSVSIVHVPLDARTNEARFRAALAASRRAIEEELGR